MKGIILAGGNGTRLYPLTKVISKQLLPIYDKPMIYYSLSVLMLAGIKDILLISTPQDIDRFKLILGNGSEWGIQLSYAVQSKPNGLAEAFLIGESFIGNDHVALVLGDNIFYGQGLTSLLTQSIMRHKGATIFAYYVNNPSQFGVIDFDKRNKVVSIEEKPENPKSNYAVTGLYIYDNRVIEIAKNLTPSSRGELEITDINNVYLEMGELQVEILGRGYAWLDTGTHETLLQASQFIETIEKRQSLKVACLEEIAYRKGYISKEQLLLQANNIGNNRYGEYLKKIANEV